jgi:hypothetical protein
MFAMPAKPVPAALVIAGRLITHSLAVYAEEGQLTAVEAVPVIIPTAALLDGTTPYRHAEIAGLSNAFAMAATGRIHINASTKVFARPVKHPARETAL